MDTIDTAVPEAVALAAEITYIVDGGSARYRIDGLRMNETEAHTHLTAVRGAGAAAAYSALDLATVRDSAAAREHLAVYHMGPRGHGLVREGRLMEREDARDVLVREYRSTPDEAEELLEEARRALLRRLPPETG